MYVYVVGDVDVRGKFSLLKDSRNINFIMAMNVVLLSAFSPFWAGYLKLSSCLELWVARWGGLRVCE